MTKEEELWEHEEAFHSKDRKRFRKERKIASKTDRSKYKKTDQDQVKKQAEEPVSEHLEKGRVLAILPEGVRVDFDSQEEMCVLRGSLKKSTSLLKNLIAVGDFVYVERRPSHPGLITQIAKRSSILSRADNLSRIKQQLIAVNIDQVLIVTSVVAPVLKIPLIDRYIIAAEKGNMTPVIVVNKIDLLEAEDAEAQLYEEFVQLYRSLGFCVLAVSCKTKQGLEELGQVMSGKTSVFSGQSGVGKSSLINLVTDSSLETRQVVHKTKKGAHTTTSAQLISLKSGGFCIDTPGIRSFGVWDLKAQELTQFFSEIHRFSHDCKYANCSHINEPDCAVRQAVEEGNISTLRFESYCALMRSCQKEHKKR